MRLRDPRNRLPPPWKWTWIRRATKWRMPRKPNLSTDCCKHTIPCCFSSSSGAWGTHNWDESHGEIGQIDFGFGGLRRKQHFPLVDWKDSFIIMQTQWCFCLPWFDWIERSCTLSITGLWWDSQTVVVYLVLFMSICTDNKKSNNSLLGKHEQNPSRRKSIILYTSILHTQLTWASH